SSSLRDIILLLVAPANLKLCGVFLEFIPVRIVAKVRLSPPIVEFRWQFHEMRNGPPRLKAGGRLIKAVPTTAFWRGRERVGGGQRLVGRSHRLCTKLAVFRGPIDMLARRLRRAAQRQGPRKAERQVTLDHERIPRALRRILRRP